VYKKQGITTTAFLQWDNSRWQFFAKMPNGLSRVFLYINSNAKTPQGATGEWKKAKDDVPHHMLVVPVYNKAFQDLLNTLIGKAAVYEEFIKFYNEKVKKRHSLLWNQAFHSMPWSYNGFTADYMKRELKKPEIGEKQRAKFRKAVQMIEQAQYKAGQQPRTWVRGLWEPRTATFMETVWECSQCTLINMSSAEVCKVCNAPRPPPAPRRRPRTRLSWGKIGYAREKGSGHTCHS